MQYIGGSRADWLPIGSTGKIYRVTFTKRKGSARYGIRFTGKGRPRKTTIGERTIKASA